MNTETYLYVKKHSKTGLLYFGKTTRKDVVKYLGSGKYWKKHLAKHGNEHVETIWISEAFDNPEKLKDFSLLFSELFDIENSEKWANLREENGLDGAPKGIKVSENNNFKTRNPSGSGDKNPFFGKKHSEEQKQKWSENKKGSLNPNYDGKAFTEETIKKLKKPKQRKENYKGSPGKITCIDKSGKAVQITTDMYNEQKKSGTPMSEWNFVNTRSKEALFRRKIS